IEQEIAVATYIQRVEKRPLPVMAFIHHSVGLEGIRSLLQLNPIPFSNEDDILTALRERLPEWRGLAASISVQLRSVAAGVADGHQLRRLVVTLVNDTKERITQFTCRVCLPTATLKHWQGYAFVSKQKCRDDDRYECLQFDESGRGPVPPRDQRELLTIPYCTMCALSTGEYVGVDYAPVTATVWIARQEYQTKKTIQELALEAAARGEG
ncbi:MAG TPA: hypothetical protein VES66_01275, partial [Terriglobales bacterium]|nr:hypothetical protein [Terriglobales bacterium]